MPRLLLWEDRPASLCSEGARGLPSCLPGQLGALWLSPSWEEVGAQPLRLATPARGHSLPLSAIPSVPAIVIHVPVGPDCVPDYVPV